MEQTLAERLLERFTPEELATVRAALARIEDRAKATLDALPKSSETEKVPTPASDSVKGEVDKFERKIIRRNNDILLVEVGNGWTVCKDNGTVFWGASGIKKWVTEQSPQVRSTNEYAHALKLFSEATAATSLELPTANPAASAKGDDAWLDAFEGKFRSNAKHPTTDVLFEAIVELSHRVKALERDLAELREATK